MRKFLLAASVAVAFLLSGVATNSAKADHGQYGSGYGGYGDPACRTDHHHHHHSGYAPRYSGYGSGYGGGRVTYYSSTIVPVYRNSAYPSHLHGSAYGMPGYGPVGFPYGAPQYGVGYGSGYYGSGFSNPVPRVQLRIGF